MMSARRLGSVLAVLLLSSTTPYAQTRGPAIAADANQQLKFRYIGPVGNRLIAVAGGSGAPNVYYAGAASGAIFKTTDNGAPWDPIFDRKADPSIGPLAVA